MQRIEITADTPLSALFRKEHHEMLRDIINSWQSALTDSSEKDALEMTSFRFDFDRLRPIEVYLDLTKLVIHDGLCLPLSLLAHYMATHSNLSKSEVSLYTQLKRYRRLCKKN